MLSARSKCILSNRPALPSPTCNTLRPPLCSACQIPAPRDWPPDRFVNAAGAGAGAEGHSALAGTIRRHVPRSNRHHLMYVHASAYAIDLASRPTLNEAVHPSSPQTCGVAAGKGRNMLAGLCSPIVTCSHCPLSTQVEGGDIARPSWLGFAVHLFNSAVAWTDILIAHPRSFTRRSERISLGLILFFTLWILLCSYFNGAFPYPFLNALPWPQVSLLRSAVGMAVRQGGTQVGCSHVGRAFPPAFLSFLPRPRFIWLCVG